MFLLVHIFDFLKHRPDINFFLMNARLELEEHFGGTHKLSFFDLPSVRHPPRFLNRLKIVTNFLVLFCLDTFPVKSL